MIIIYLCSLLDDDERFFDIWLMFNSDDFREFPIIPDRGEEYSNNIYSWFKFCFRQYETEMSLERSLREAERILREAENKTENKTKQFSDEVDKVATEVISCKICLVKALKWYSQVVDILHVLVVQIN